MGTFRFDRNGNICPIKTISFDASAGTTGKVYYYVRAKGHRC